MLARVAASILRLRIVGAIDAEGSGHRGAGERVSESEIRRMSRARATLIGKRRFDEMVDGFYASDAKLMPSGSSTARGVEEIRDFWRATPEHGLVELTLEPRDVEISGDLGYEIGRFSRTLRPRHGAPFQESGKYVVIYRRQAPDRWRAIAEMFNSDSRR